MHGPASPCFSIKLLAVEFSVPVFAGIVVIATGEFDEHARLIPHGPRIVTRWQQHHIILREVLLRAIVHHDPKGSRKHEGDVRKFTAIGTRVIFQII